MKMPTSNNQEAIALGCILQKPELLFEAAGLNRFWFYDQAHRLTFEACKAVLEAEADIPAPAFRAFVLGRLRDDLGEDAAFRGVPIDDLVAELISEAISPAVQFPTALEKLCDCYQRRRLCDYSRELFQRAASGEGTASDVLASAHDATTEIAAIRVGQSDHAAAVDEWYETTVSSIDGHRPVGRQARTNIWAIDHLLAGGGTFGHYTVVAAKKKMGKTRLTTRLAYELAMQGYPVDHYAVEMTTFEMLSLYATCITERPYRDLATHYVDDARRMRRQEEAVKAKAALQELPIRLFSGRRNVREVELNTYARAAKESKPLVVIADYLQILTSHGKNEYERVTNATKSLAQLAPSTNAWVIATSQFNRSVEGMPKPHNLRSSGQIEQDVDELLIFHRPAEEVEDSSDEQKRRGILWLALNRHGETNRVEVDCDMPKLEFRNVDGYAF